MELEGRPPLPGGCEFLGRPIAQSAVRPDAVIMLSPAFDQHFGCQKRVEDLAIQQHIPQFAVEGLDVAVLPGAVGVDERCFCADFRQATVGLLFRLIIPPPNVAALPLNEQLVTVGLLPELYMPPPTSLGDAPLAFPPVMTKPLRRVSAPSPYTHCTT